MIDPNPDLPFQQQIDEVRAAAYDHDHVVISPIAKDGP
jgi:hypothetical protein